MRRTTAAAGSALFFAAAPGTVAGLAPWLITGWRAAGSTGTCATPCTWRVLGAIAGQALILSRPVLLLYAAAVGAGFGAFVRWYEEPTLTRRYGASYPAHQRAVPGWLPRPCPAELIAAAARLRARRRAAAFMIAETRCGPDNTELP